LGANSKLKMSSYHSKFDKNEREVQLDLIIGAGKFKVKKLRGKESFIVKTPTAVAGVRGTEFIVKHRIRRGRPLTSLLVKKGRISLRSKKFSKRAKPTIVKTMESSSVSGGETPSEPKKVSVAEVKAEEKSTGTSDSSESSSEVEESGGSLETKSESQSSSESSEASVKTELKASISNAIKQIVSPVKPRVVQNTQVERIIKQIDDKRVEKILISRPPSSPNTPSAP
jgi:hypothetical protein